MALKLFRHARIYTPLMGGRPAVGDEQGKLAVYEDGCFLVEDGCFLAVGATRDVEGHLKGRAADREFDLGRAAVVPGFVDPHTHACFAALREEEFSMRLAGKQSLSSLQHILLHR